MICKLGYIFDAAGNCVSLSALNPGVENCLRVVQSDNSKCEICLP